MKLLTKIADKYKTDKGTINGEGHSYTEFYDKFLNNQIPAEYFPESNIYGLDIDLSRSKNKINSNKNIHIFLCDATNKNDIDKFLNKIGNIKFDIIIDDGSHIPEHQMRSLLIWMNHLKKDGIYILEDLHCNICCDNPEASPLKFLCFNQKSDCISKEEYKILNDKIDTVEMFINFNKRSYPQFKNRSITSIIKFQD